jgi:putative transposase
VNPVLSSLRRLIRLCLDRLHTRFVRWTRPLKPSLLLGTIADLGRSKSELMTENALLRQHLIMLKRQVKRIGRSSFSWQGWFGHGNKLASLVQPDTLLHWHRELFRLYWKRRSKASSHKPKVDAETISLIKKMAKENRLWGAERMRGELLKLGIHVCKRTIQKYMRHVRLPQPGGQKWATFLHNHVEQILACDFLQVTDLCFRPLFAFFIIELKSRKVIHVGVTRSPTDPWVAQQLREATPYGQVPKYLIRDNDSNLGLALLTWRQRVLLGFSKRPIMRHEPMRSANAS